MSNMAGITNDMYPEGTVATTEGFTGPHGEVLLNVDFTQAEVDAFNGTSSDLPETTVTTTSDDSPETPKVKPKAAKKKKKPAKKEKKWFKK
jgi:hypothetical protein|tara:strand:- start:496 stop:768 length:273 start_codon:yes stop_codon:yes gene_type:complete